MVLQVKQDLGKMDPKVENKKIDVPKETNESEPKKPEETAEGTEINPVDKTLCSSIPNNQRRMITTTGQITEVDTNQEESQEHHYETAPTASSTLQRHEEYNQVTEEASHFNYESSAAHEQPDVAQPTSSRLQFDKPNSHIVAHHTQTLYVVQREDGTSGEMVQYHPRGQPPMSNMRGYEERYHHKYPNQFPHVHHPQMVKSEIEGHQVNNQIIYEAETQSEIQVDGAEPKTQYTNLEPMQNLPSSYYLASTGYSASNVTYVQGSSNKEEFYAFHPGSSNPILCKNDPTLTSSTLPGKQLQYTSLNGAHPIYENTIVQSPSPSSQPTYTYCKAEPPYWSGVDYNAANSFPNGPTTIVIENGPNGTTEYANAHQWIQEGYETHLVDSSTAEIKECVVCSNSYGPMKREPGSGHFICNNCDGAPRTQMRQFHRGQKPKPAIAAGARRTGVTCANCSTTSTTLWRRNNQGEPVCNACGLYFKLHNINRPLTMKKEGIQTRKRKPKSTQPQSAQKMNDKILPTIVPSHIHPDVKVLTAIRGPYQSTLAGVAISSQDHHFIEIQPQQTLQSQSSSQQSVATSSLTKHITTS